MAFTRVFTPYLSTETIMEEIRGRGFSITRQKETLLSRELAEELYTEHREQPYFDQLVDSMCG